MKETDIIQRLQAACPTHEEIILGIGDDAAVLAPYKGSTLVCKDMLLDGVHFIVKDTDPALLGHKALAVNLSDIAAMGGRASSAYVGLALPRSLNNAAFLDSLYEGINRLAERYHVAIAGGDTNVWDGPFAISVTVIGHSHPRGAITRSGAQLGDVIYVTGPLGDSYATGHHLRFTPRLNEAKELLDRVKINSMIDLSDGLGKDLRLICEQSGLRACLQRDQIPLRSSLRAIDREVALTQALSDGEDFELCFTISPDEARRLPSGDQLPCFPIGRMTQGQGLAWEGVGGTLDVIKTRGYEHGV